jgi:hypothetical protein
MQERSGSGFGPQEDDQAKDDQAKDDQQTPAQQDPGEQKKCETEVQNYYGAWAVALHTPISRDK